MKRALRTGLVLLTAYLLVLAAGSLWARAETSQRPCPGSGSVVLVDAAARVLCLCGESRVEGRFHVALGRRGLGKHREFDGKTPLGRYDLQQAMPSSRFHLFLPVGFPTAEQKANGYSGSAIGIHGPHAGFAWLVVRGARLAHKPARPLSRQSSSHSDRGCGRCDPDCHRHQAWASRRLHSALRLRARRRAPVMVGGGAAVSWSACWASPS